VSDRPFVTVAIPCFNEEHHIATCIRDILAQDYPADRFEIIVADGMSTDGTRLILGRLAREDPRVKLIDNPERIQSQGMNHILRQCRGEVIARVDVHCEYAPDYIRRCVEVLARTGADVVGGAQRARATTLFQRAVCVALDSPLGVGGARYRSAANEGWVDTVFLGAFRRHVFETVGLYDPGAVTNEDAELNQRVIAAGGRVYLSRDIVVHYHPRKTPRTLLRQYFRYGKGRARTLLKHRRFLSIRPAIPFLTVVAGLLLLATTTVQPFTPVAFGIYAVAATVEAFRLGRRGGRSTIPVAAAVFPMLHAAHGAGFALGLVRYLSRRDWRDAERLRARETQPRAVA
jgi:succinoglycan biosynthesis protein ExoA